MSSRLLVALALAAQLRSVDSKVHVARATLSREAGRGQQWQFVTKFGFALGESAFTMRARQVPAEGQPLLDYEVSLDMERYVDEQWPAAEATLDPCERRSVGKPVTPMWVGEDGEWGQPLRGEVAHRVRPHVWYFAVAACGAELPPNGTYTFEVEFEGRQPDGSHFGVESAWSPLSCVTTLLACSCILWSCLRKMGSVCGGDAGSLHPVVRTLAAVVASQYIAQVLHIGHLAIYSANGQGSLVMEVVAEALTTTSQVAETTLLILIASGYTITRAKLGDFSFSLPIFIAVALAHAALVVADKAQEEASHVFTTHDGLKGWAFLSTRVCLYAWFSVAARRTADQDGGYKVRAFLRQFRMAASLYFLAYPLAILVTPIFAAYWRKAVVEFVLVAAQVSCNVWLASLFLGRGAYYEVSSLGASLLPGGCSRSSRFLKDD